METKNSKPLKTIFPSGLLRYWIFGKMILFAVQLVDLFKILSLFAYYAYLFIYTNEKKAKSNYVPVM